jgi:NADH-quinone oxidoreductase subunit J
MNIEFLIFLIVAAIAVVASLGLLLSRNAIYAAMFLILNFAAVAVIYILLNAPFIAAVQVAVYAGAIMVLFVFVIMLLGAERLSTVEVRSTMKWQRPLATILGLLLIIMLGAVILTRASTGTALKMIDTSPFAIGKALFTTFLLPFEIASVLLLAAMVGAVVLTKKE